MKKTPLISPLCLMVSTEPVSLKDDSDFFVSEDFLGKISKESFFRLTFSSFKDPKGLFHLSYMIEDNEGENDPAIMTSIVKDINDSKALEFTLYPLKFFNLFKRAILVFDNKKYTIQEFQDLVSQWKINLKDSDLEV